MRCVLKMRLWFNGKLFLLQEFLASITVDLATTNWYLANNIQKFTLYGKLGYTRNVNHYYGFREENAALISDADMMSKLINLM